VSRIEILNLEQAILVLAKIVFLGVSHIMQLLLILSFWPSRWRIHIVGS
jgi:hypothetical protein